jgi:O-antigen/teichoic acid export membrane protein
MDSTASSLLAAPIVQPVARRIRLNSIWLLLARLITQAQLVVFTVLVARSLGVGGFGQYAFVAALIFLGNIATTFGTDTLLIREVARNRQPNDGLIPSALWIQLTLSVTWLIVVGLGADALGGKSPEVVTALKVYSLSLIPLAFFTIFTSVLRAHERMDVYLLLSGLVALMQLGGAGWVLSQNGGLLSLVMMLNFVQLSAAIIAGVLCRNSLPAFHFHWTVSRAQLIGVVRLAWPFALLGVLWVIYQRLGVLMLSTLGTDTQAGWYAAATRVIEPLRILHFAVLGALLPALTYLGAPHLGAPTADRQQVRLASIIFRRSMLFLLTFSMLAAGAIIVLAQPIVTLLFGASYTDSVVLVQILALSLIPYTLSASWSVRLVTQGQERRVLWVTALGVLLAFILNRALIPSYGSSGAALAAVGSESFLALLLVVVRR